MTLTAQSRTRFSARARATVSECFGNAVFGGLDNFGTDAYLLHALVVLNGNCVAQLPDPDVEYRLVRVLGQVLGLGWSQTNLNIQTRIPPPTSDDYRRFHHHACCRSSELHSDFRRAIPTVARSILTSQKWMIRRHCRAYIRGRPFPPPRLVFMATYISRIRADSRVRACKE